MHEVYLGGNPLSPEALERDITELDARGVLIDLEVSVSGAEEDKCGN